MGHWLKNCFFRTPMNFPGPRPETDPIVRFRFQQGFLAEYAPYAVLFLVATYLGGAWILVAMVDFLNFGGVQSWMREQQSPMPLVWYHIFSEGRWIERGQWLLLGGAALCAFSMWRWTRREAVSELDLALLLLFAGASLMLIEDSLNFRHVIADHYLATLFEDSTLPKTVRMAWVGAFYLFLSALMIGPVAVLFLYRSFSKRVYLLTFAAYGLYALAGFGSALRALGRWQETLGDWVILRVNLAELPAWSHTLENMAHWRETIDGYTFTLGYLLIDHLVEESLELMAAGLLLAAFLAIRTELLNTDDGNGLRRNDREAQILFNVVRRGLDSTRRRQTSCSRPKASYVMRQEADRLPVLNGSREIALFGKR